MKKNLFFKYFYLLLFVFLFGTMSAQDDSDYKYMLNNHKNVTYKITIIENEYNNKIKVNLTFPENYFSKKALLTINPIINGTLETKNATQNFKGEKKTGGGIVVKYSEGYSGSFTFIKTFNKDLKINDVKLQFTLTQDGLSKKILPTNLSTSSQNTEIDIAIATISDIASLISRFEKNKNYDTLVNLNETLGDKYYVENNYSEARSAYEEAINYALQTDKNVKAGKLYSKIGKISFEQDNNMQAIKDFENALGLFKGEDENKLVETTYNSLASIYISTLYYNDAVESYEQAIEYCEGDLSQIVIYKNRIANTLIDMKKYTEASIIYKDIINIEKKLENNLELIKSFNNIAALYIEINNLELARKNLDTAFNLNEIHGEKINETHFLNNQAGIYFMSENYVDAKTNYNNSLKINAQQIKKRTASISLHNLGKIFFTEGNNEQAKDKLTGSNVIANDNNFNDIVSYNLNMLGKLLISQASSCAEPFEAYQEYLQQRGINTENENKPLVDFIQKYELSKSKSELFDEITIKEVELKEKEKINKKQQLKNDNLLLENKLKDERNKQQKKIILILIIGIILILLFAILTIRLYLQKKRANQELVKKNVQITMQKEEIQTQADELLIKNEKILIMHDDLKERNEEIEKKNRKITASIEYAKNIQNALLPSKKHLNHLLGKHFIYFIPRDTVSGDFYWAAQINKDAIIVVAADCTGHGVPGAMMSMLGISMLNEIIIDLKITEPVEILNKLREMVIKYINTDNDDGDNIIRDGMDLALLKINKKTLKLEFVGANNPLLLIRDKKIHLYEADLMPVGMFIMRIDKSFSSTKIDLKKDDMLYIFSDGYSDQFGHKSNRKYYFSNFKILLQQISDKPVLEQEHLVDANFNHWKGATKQIDDVLVMGIKI